VHHMRPYHHLLQGAYDRFIPHCTAAGVCVRARARACVGIRVFSTASAPTH